MPNQYPIYEGETANLFPISPENRPFLQKSTELKELSKCRTALQTSAKYFPTIAEWD
jgi:hypothetical protein